MNKVLEFLKGKKSYVAAGIICVFGCLEAFDVWIPPEWIYVVLTGVLGIAIRAGVEKVKDAVKP